MNIRKLSSTAIMTIIIIVIVIIDIVVVTFPLIVLDFYLSLNIDIRYLSKVFDLLLIFFVSVLDR